MLCSENQVFVNARSPSCNHGAYVISLVSSKENRDIQTALPRRLNHGPSQASSFWLPSFLVSAKLTSSPPSDGADSSEAHLRDWIMYMSSVALALWCSRESDPCLLGRSKSLCDRSATLKTLKNLIRAAKPVGMQAHMVPRPSSSPERSIFSPLSQEKFSESTNILRAVRRRMLTTVTLRCGERMISGELYGGEGRRAFCELTGYRRRT